MVAGLVICLLAGAHDAFARACTDAVESTLAGDRAFVDGARFEQAPNSDSDGGEVEECDAESPELIAFELELGRLIQAIDPSIGKNSNLVRVPGAPD